MIWLNPAVHWKVQRGGVKDKLAESYMVNAPEETVTREVLSEAVKELRDNSRSCVRCSFAHGEDMEDVFGRCPQPLQRLAEEAGRIKSSVLGKVVLVEIIT